MGSLGVSIHQVKTSVFGAAAQAQNLAAIDRLWSRIEAAAEELPVEQGVVRLYQDGLPVCGRELEIASELATAGNRNFELLLKLQARGAILMGTESGELLVKEYKHATRAIALASGKTARGNSAEEQSSLLDQRDRFIAKRIDKTLGPGEAGILFLGMLHAVPRYLQPDIEVLYPLAQLR